MIAVASAPFLQTAFPLGAGAAGAAGSGTPSSFEQLLGSLFNTLPAPAVAPAPRTAATVARTVAADQDAPTPSRATPDLLSMLLAMAAQRLSPVATNTEAQAP